MGVGVFVEELPAVLQHGTLSVFYFVSEELVDSAGLLFVKGVPRPSAFCHLLGLVRFR